MLHSIRRFALPASLLCTAAAFAQPGDVRDGRLLFETNLGQGGETARFLSRAANYVLVLSRDEIGFVSRTGAASLRMIGANPHPTVEGSDRSLTTLNYFVGKDPAHWHTNVPAYHEVRYRDLYPGVNLVFHGTRTTPEFDWELMPGADAGAIRFRFSGAKLDARGDLIVADGAGEFKVARPAIYQSSGESGRIRVSGEYVEKSGGEFSLSVGSYDRTRALIIDPTVTYATFLGGSSDDAVFGVALDQAGNSYLTGETSSPDFPQMPANQRQFNSSMSLAFVSKIDGSGKLISSTYLGGTQGDIGYGIAVDSAGNIYVAGSTASPDFPTTQNAYQPGCTQTATGGCSRAFLTKLNSSGQMQYSTYLGGDTIDYGLAVAIDDSGHAWVAGAATSLNFPVTAGAAQTGCLYIRNPNSPNWCSDPFVAKFDTTLSGTASLIYSTYAGDTGSPGTGAAAIAVDGRGNAYIVGSTTAGDFNPTPGAYNAPGGAYGEVFVTEINPTGSKFLYTAFVGGGGGFGIAVDAQGEAYVSGSASSGFHGTAGAYQQTVRGNSDAFVVKLNAAGSLPIYATLLGGTGTNDDETAYAIKLDSSGSAYIAGVTDNADFPLAHATSGYGGGKDAFVAQLSPSGSQLLFSTYIGGSAEDDAYALALNPGSGDVFVGGASDSADFLNHVYSNGLGGAYPNVFPPSLQATHGAGASLSDGFLVRISPRPFLSLIVSSLPILNCRVANCSHVSVIQIASAYQLTGGLLSGIQAKTVSGSGEVKITGVTAGARMSRNLDGRLVPPIPLREKDELRLQFVVPKGVKRFAVQFEGTALANSKSPVRWGAEQTLTIARPK
jgi:hypothetical protein